MTVAKAERFDAVENKWEEIANMRQKRGYAFDAATEEKIFVAGGRENWASCLKTCEMFNIWIKRMAVNWKFECCSCIWQHCVSEGNTLCAGWYRLLMAK